MSKLPLQTEAMVRGMHWSSPAVPTRRTRRYHRFDFVVVGTWFVVLVQSTETTDVTSAAWMRSTRDMETGMKDKLVAQGLQSMEDVLAFWGLHAAAYARLVRARDDGKPPEEFECPMYARRFLREPYRPTVVVLEGIDAVVPFILNMETCTFRNLVPPAAWEVVGRRAPPEASESFEKLVQQAWRMSARSPSLSPPASPVSPSPLGSFCERGVGSASPPLTPRVRRSATTLRAGGSARQRRRRLTNGDMRPGSPAIVDIDNDDIITSRSSTDPEDMMFRLEIEAGGSE